jgi:DNA-binding GntR family transcriptional regulator
MTPEAALRLRVAAAPLRRRSKVMAKFEIGRTTARCAIAWLRETGLVETLPGRGTYVP